MSPRTWCSLPLAALALAALLPLSALAAPPLSVKGLPAAGALREITPAAHPVLDDRNARVELMVKLSGQSVADLRAAAPDHRLDPARRSAALGTLRSAHAAAERGVQALGGRVERHLYHAWNGMRVSVPRSAVARLSAMAGVTQVLPVRIHRLENERGVPYIGAPTAWAGTPAYTGAGVKVAVIDTGIDYTHADFGGPGTTKAYDSAHAQEAAAADPALFGPNAPKVKGGIDLAGDAYDADANPVAVPDDNPLDCNGHGSHVAGTIAGFGVTNDGLTYTGAYGASTYATDFLIGPGVAPEAELYAVRVFGCSGSTSLVVEALDWAVEHDMDVVNMSLGSPFGDEASADSQAADAAAAAGVVVVTSAGNSGPEPYLSGSPGAANGALATAAVDAWTTYPAAALALSTGATVNALNANIAALPSGSIPLQVLGGATISNGCYASDYPADVAGKIAVVQRGVCTLVTRIELAQAAGAAAVVLINNQAGLPPFIGPYEDYTVPLLEVTQADGAAVVAAASATLSAGTPIANADAGVVADFSSGGPRFYDSALKPDVAAPGVMIYSVAVGTGYLGAYFDGTSMASPHAAGVAALTVQAHRGWGTDALRAAIENTASAAALVTTDARLVGAGLVQPALSTKTQAVAFAAGAAQGQRRAALDFGFLETSGTAFVARRLVVENHGTATASFVLSAKASGGVRHTVTLSQRTLRIPAGQSRTVTVSLAVPGATVGDSSALRQVAGAVTIAPASRSDNGGVTLRVPYYAVPRARAQVFARYMGFPPNAWLPRATVLVGNLSRAVPGTADFYAWGLSSPNDGLGAMDLKAAGVQALASDGDQLLVFAVATQARWSSLAAHEVDIDVDTNGDGAPDAIVFTYDYGALTTGYNDGTVGVFLYVVATKKTYVTGLSPYAPTDGSTLLVPFWAADLGLSAASPRLAYSVATHDGQTGASDEFDGWAKFNAWTPALVLPETVALDGGALRRVPVSLDKAELAKTRPLGVMVVKQEDKAGASQVDLLPLR